METLSFLDSLSWTPEEGASEEYSLYNHILGETMLRGQLAAFNSGTAFVMDIGTPETFALARQPGGPCQDYLCNEKTSYPYSYSLIGGN